MMRRVLFLVVALAFVAGSAAYAHHSYAATYDTTKEIKLEGKLVQFVYRNPHSFVHVEAPDDKGNAAAVGGRMERRRPARQPGRDERLAQGRRRGGRSSGRPSRVTGEFRALMVNLKRPADGFTWGGRGQVVD